MSQGSVSGRATAIGLMAVVLWSAMVALVRTVTETFGATLGAALIYSVAAVILWIVRRPASLRKAPRRYLLLGGLLFVAYEISFSLALGMASDASQAIEVSVLNYLWPTFTVVLSVIVNRAQRAGWTLIPGVILAMMGIVWVVAGDMGFDAHRVLENIASNPLPYLLAFGGAVIWAIYSVFTPRFSRGYDGIAPFFAATAVGLWVIYAVMDRSVPEVVAAGDGLSVLVAAVVIAGGYACWNIGILGGNVTIMATASYATPVFSSAIASLLLGAALSTPFRQGVLLVTIGSLLCWWATRSPRPRAA
ncbi:MAG: aromatic amino acid DMT transporter YddG [Ancrocorticia sp.]